MRPRERILRLVILMIGNPFRFTRRELAERHDVNKKTIDDDIREMIAADLHFLQDDYYRCAILPDKSFEELQFLMPLTEEEQGFIGNAIDQISGSSKKAMYLKKKVYSLYDFQRLGLRALRRPELEKLDALESAKNSRTRVILENYRSNSNEIKNRIVEPFHVDTENNMLQAFDVESEDNRHFKIRRIKRVQPTNIQWSFEKSHKIQYTDVFRIADNKLINIHLELDVYALNILYENYPRAKADVEPCAIPNTYDFQTRVNHKFIGLTNFILGNRGHVKIIGPDNLKAHIINEAKKIISQIDDAKLSL